MSLTSLRRASLLGFAALLLSGVLGAAARVAHAQSGGTQVGRIAARGVVRRNDSGAIDPSGTPTWVIYKDDNSQAELPCKELSRGTTDTQVMPADEYATWLSDVALADAEPNTNKIGADAYKNGSVRCLASATATTPASVQPAVGVIALAPTTHTVILTQPTGDGTPCANLIRLQSPLAPDAKPLNDKTKSILVNNDSGQVLCEAEYAIGYETAFMFGGEHGVSANDTPTGPGCNQKTSPVNGGTQSDFDVWSFVTCSPGNMLLPTPGKAGSSDLMVWSPIFGADMEMANYESIRTATSGTNGQYTLYYTTLPPYSFSFNVDARLAFDSFNPRMASSHYFYMTGKGSSTSNGVSYTNFPVELAMVHVRATLGNPSSGANITPATLVGVKYGASLSQQVDGVYVNATSYTIGSGDDIGLVSQISAPDLRDTDLFVFRVSDGHLIGSRWGLSSNEIGWGKTPTENGGPARFEASALVRGPASRWLSVVTNAFNPATNVPAVYDKGGKVVTPAQFGLEVAYKEGADGRDAYLRAGDLLKVILVNRATGYIGTRLAKLATGSSGLPVLVQADGAGAAVTPDGVAGGPALQFSMKPPNLKVRVQREYTVEKGATKEPDPTRKYVIGFEGAGLSSDDVITVETEWYDADGTALPDELPGYTGRLAKTVLAAELPDAGVKLSNGATAPVGLKGVDCATCGSDKLGMFSIEPGRQTHVVRLRDTEIETSHFYVHVDAQPLIRNVDFSGRVEPSDGRFDVNQVCYRVCVDPNDLACTEKTWSCIPRFGAGTDAALAQRPTTYVPFLAPKYNKTASDAAAKYASDNKLSKPDPIYDWHYRPEMQFSIFDLDVKELSTADTNGATTDALQTATLPEAGNGIVKLIYSINDPDVAALPSVSLQPDGTAPPPPQLAFSLGKQEVSAQYDSTTQTVEFVAPKAIDQLQSDDYLTLRLVQKGDEGNVLWEYGFETLHVMLEGGVTTVKTGESVRAIAFVLKDGKLVEKAATWKLVGDPVPAGVDASINNSNGMLSAARDSKHGYVTIRAQDLDDPLVFKEEKVKIGCECQKCMTPGGCESGVGSIDAVFSLGRSSNGSSAGSIYLYSHSPTADVFTPKALVFSSLDPEVTALFGADKSLRQITAPNTFVDVVALSEEAYEVRFYKPLADNVTPDETSGFYAPPSEPPDAFWRVEKVSSSTPGFGALLLSEHRDGEVTTVEYDWDPAQHDWTLVQGSGIVQEHHQETIAGLDRVVRVEVKDTATGIVSSVKQLTYHTFPFGEKLVQEVLDPSDATHTGEELVTATTYYEDTDHPRALGMVASVSNPDGSWVRYTYDDEGRIASETRPWLDAGSLSTDAEARITVYNYSPNGSLDVLFSPADGEASQPRTVTEYALGSIVSKTFYLYQRTDLGDRTVTEERCTQPSCSYGDPTSLRTVTEYYASHPDEASNGKVKTIVHPDGQLESYTYEYGVYNAQSATFFAEPGLAVRQTVTHGTTQNPYGVSYKSTREVAITDARGNGARDESYVFVGGTSYELTSWTNRDYDDRGHMIRSTRSTGELEAETWDCCAQRTSLDARGIETIYTPDALQRIQVSQRAGISTSYKYDGDGRVLTSSRDGGGLTLTTSKSYDLAGRVRESTDESGLTTAYDYPSGGRQTSVTHPGMFTEVTDQFLDGQQRSVTGTAAVPQFFTYSVNGDGTRVTEVRLASANSPVFERTVVDMLGRTVRVERPGFGGAVATTETFYNLQGQVARTQTTGLADTFYQYDEVGQQVRSGLDVDGNGALATSGTDRVTDSLNHFTSISGQWWQETQQSVYASASDTAVVASTSRTRLTGLGGGLVSEQVSIDLQGNETHTTVTIDPSSRTETQRTDVPDSSQDAVAVSIDGRLFSSTSAAGVTMTYDYDGLGRRTGVTDPRTGRSQTHYETATGRVDFVKDAAGNTTTFGYETATGRKLSETNALGKTTYFAYDARGELVQTWGDVPYPVEYVYDDYGRRTEMRTYRSALNFSTASWPTGTEMAADPTHWIYEEATGLLLQKQDAAGQAAQYTYDTAGRLKTRTWARPKSGGGALVTTYGYDSSTGELLNVDYNDSTPDVTYTYDRLGRQNTVVDGAGGRTFGYDTNTLQLLTETMTGLTPAVLTHHYETSTVKGRPVGITLGSSYDVAYGYDTAGRMNSVDHTTNGAHDVATYTYVPNSALLSGMTTQTGQAVAYSYEAHRDLKTQVQNKFGSTVVSQYDYAYDAIDRRSSVKNSGSAFAAAAFSLWGYDDRNQLTSSGRYLGTNVAVTTSPVPAQARGYQYDPIGNRQSSTSGGTPTSYSANGVNEYTTVGAQSPIYDNDGNLTNDGSKVLTYNAENQLVQVAPVAPLNGSKRVTFVYDYQGRRVRKTVETFSGSTWSTSETKTWVYAGWNKVQESKTVGGTTTTKSFAWGLDLSQRMEGAGGIGGLLASADATGEKLFAYDDNGNVSELLTSAGVVNAHYEYDAFGNAVLSTGTGAGENCYRFSAKYQDDETGLYYYGYRYYEPLSGRWEQPDPTQEQGGIALYVFASNSAVDNVDALGLRPATAGERAAWTSVFDSAVAKRLINNYMDDTGATVNLSQGEMVSIAAVVSIKRSAAFSEALQNARKNKLSYFFFGGSGLGGARANGTLGNFWINYLGTVDVCSDSWKFDGRMSFSDEWDFNITGAKRPILAQGKVIAGRLLLPGRSFRVTSDWIEVKQTSKQNEADWAGKKTKGQGDDVTNDIASEL